MAANQVGACRQSIEQIAHDDVLELAECYPDDTALELDWQALRDADGELAENVLRRPDEMLEAFDDALRTYPALERAMANARVRFVNLPDEKVLTVGSERVDDLNRLVGFNGQITKRSEVGPVLRVGAFRCPFCGEIRRIDQPPYGKMREPAFCYECEKQVPFRKDERESEWADHQKVRLQQPPEDAIDGVTATIDLHLFDDLCADPDAGGVQCGMRATFLGKYEPVEYKKLVRHKKTVISNNFEPEQQAFEDVDTSEYADEIRTLAARDDLFDTLVDAIAPTIHGVPHVKQALLLQLFGGWARTTDSGAYQRGNSHVFLLGDPGVGKTVLMEAIAKIAPRAAFTDGTGTSAAGLTAALVKDDFTQGEQWTIEAGTLPLAHEGLAVVDEIGKGGNDDLDALHSALESQKVYVSKAGKQATLPAETALLAADNPTGGHFDPTADIADQVTFQSPLLSRFDLIFTMTEATDESEIRRIAEIMVDSRQIAGLLDRGDDVPDGMADVTEPSVARDLLRAYIAYARTEHAPVIEIDDPDLKRDLVDWYTDLKLRVSAEDAPLPVTARKLSGVERLAEASARMRLDDSIRRVDLERATRLVDRSLADIGIAPAGGAAFGRVATVDPAEVGI